MEIPPFQSPAVSVSEMMQIRRALRHDMWAHVGIVREASGLQYVLDQCGSWEQQLGGRFCDSRYVELQNMIRTAILITESALSMGESQGCHYRQDLVPH